MGLTHIYPSTLVAIDREDQPKNQVGAIIQLAGHHVTMIIRVEKIGSKVLSDNLLIIKAKIQP